MKTGIFCICSRMRKLNVPGRSTRHKKLSQKIDFQPKFKFQAVSSASRSSKLALRTFFLSIYSLNTTAKDRIYCRPAFWSLQVEE